MAGDDSDVGGAVPKEQKQGWGQVSANKKTGANEIATEMKVLFFAIVLHSLSRRLLPFQVTCPVSLHHHLFFRLLGELLGVFRFILNKKEWLTNSHHFRLQSDRIPFLLG